jgi:uncharacterized protein
MRKLLAAIVAAALAAGTAHAQSPGFNFQPTGPGNAFKFQLEPTGPSFNCNYAKAPDEVAVCQTPELSRLDREMARLYSEAMNYYRGGSRDSIRRDQAAWLNSRHRCGCDANCIKDAYNRRCNRLAYLGGID